MRLRPMQIGGFMGPLLPSRFWLGLLLFPALGQGQEDMKPPAREALIHSLNQKKPPTDLPAKPMVSTAAPIRAFSRPSNPASMRESLLECAQACRTLNAQAIRSPWAGRVVPRDPNENRNLPERRFPTQNQAIAYLCARPWAWNYCLKEGPQPRFRPGPMWPEETDGSGLRTLLMDSNPEVRGLAVEALAVLQRPEDMECIALLLDDQAPSVPALVPVQITQTLLPGSLLGPVPAYAWHPRTVASLARQALRFLTGKTFDAPAFKAWWPANREPRKRVWYWQERLLHELAAAESASDPDMSPLDLSSAEAMEYQASMARRRLAALARMGAEVTRLDPETETKIRLLVVQDGIPLLGPMARSRLAPERLLELLERKGLWADVDWESLAFPKPFTLLQSGILRQAEHLFRPEQVVRLRAALLKEEPHPENWNSGVILGLSRLLPKAPADNPDQPDTRDAMLRWAVLNHASVFTRGDAAAELVGVGLEAHWPFLEAAFWKEASSTDGWPDLRCSLLRALSQAPASVAKQERLARLLLDPRFRPLWLAPLHGPGDSHREEAIQAVNTLVGREVLDHRVNPDLNGGDDATLNEVLFKVQEALVGPPRVPKTSSDAVREALLRWAETSRQLQLLAPPTISALRSRSGWLPG